MSFHEIKRDGGTNFHGSHAVVFYGTFVYHKALVMLAPEIKKTLHFEKIIILSQFSASSEFLVHVFI